MEDRIKRIQAMEVILNELLEVLPKAESAMEEFEQSLPQYKILLEYYQSSDWIEDREADINKEIPQDMNRGVLSEDGIWNLMTDYFEFSKKVSELRAQLKFILKE